MIVDKLGIEDLAPFYRKGQVVNDNIPLLFNTLLAPCGGSNELPADSGVVSVDPLGFVGIEIAIPYYEIHRTSEPLIIGFAYLIKLTGGHRVVSVFNLRKVRREQDVILWEDEEKFGIEVFERVFNFNTIARIYGGYKRLFPEVVSYTIDPFTDKEDLDRFSTLRRRAINESVLTHLAIPYLNMARMPKNKGE
jgi:hypothetical protein